MKTEKNEQIQKCLLIFKIGYAIDNIYSLVQRMRSRKRRAII